MSNSLDISERAERLKGRTLQTMRDFLRRYDVPRDLEKNVMQWIDFDVGHKITHTGNQMYVVCACVVCCVCLCKYSSGCENVILCVCARLCI
jgi:hypothetical protein